MGTAEVQPPGVNGNSSSERRILLIEDSAVLTRRLIDLLSEPGRVEVAAQAKKKGNQKIPGKAKQDTKKK
jgi:hypothetical protein